MCYLRINPRIVFFILLTDSGMVWFVGEYVPCKKCVAQGAIEEWPGKRRQTTESYCKQAPTAHHKGAKKTNNSIEYFLCDLCAFAVNALVAAKNSVSLIPCLY
jgi:hypothetical protein